MMHDKENKRCQECLCPSCDLFQTSDCLEGHDYCGKCGGEYPTKWCPWHPSEQGGGIDA